MKILVRIEGGDKLRAQMGDVASRARAYLRQEINTIGILLSAYVQQTKLRGQVLKQRSGRLIASIHHEMEETDEEVNALVGTNVEYAGVHELGFRGTVQVKEHYRTIKMAWGRPITARSILVRAHPMKMDMTARPFLAPSLHEFQPTALERLRKLANRIAQEANQK